MSVNLSGLTVCGGEDTASLGDDVDAVDSQPSYLCPV